MLDQKGLDRHESVDYLRDDDEYCDEFGLTLFMYITKIKICVFLKDSEKWSTDYLANEMNCNHWLIKLRGYMYVRIEPVERNTETPQILPDEPIEYDDDCIVVQLVSPKWKRRQIVTFEETQVKRTKKSSGRNKKQRQSQSQRTNAKKDRKWNQQERCRREMLSKHAKLK